MITKILCSTYSHTDKNRGQMGFGSNENTGRKRTECFGPHHFNYPTVFALLWANFSPAVSQQMQTAVCEQLHRVGKHQQNAKTLLDFLVLPLSKQRIAVLNSKGSQNHNPAKEVPAQPHEGGCAIRRVVSIQQQSEGACATHKEKMQITNLCSALLCHSGNLQ